MRRHPTSRKVLSNSSSLAQVQGQVAPTLGLNIFYDKIYELPDEYRKSRHRRLAPNAPSKDRWGSQ
ncbi:hypothetical protein WG66_001723 [Moniliophthora roreri]|nr:hypothetical protein WG66_001723 [Moniliophthora roreri]